MSDGSQAIWRRRVLIPWMALFLVTLGCSAADLVQRNLPTPTPFPTRQLAPTFTPTPEAIEQVVIVTPPDRGTPGVIIIPPGMDPRQVLPVATPTPIPASVQPGSDSPVPPGGVAVPGAD